MKCICGYEIIEDIKVLQNPFKVIHVYVHDSQYMGVFHTDGKQTELYACPKCGTVKMDIT